MFTLQCTVGFNTQSGSAFRVSAAQVIGWVEARLASTDEVVRGRALLLHLLVLVADVVAVDTPGQVVPQLGVLLCRARHALGGSVGRAVCCHVRARGAHFTGEDSSGEQVPALVCEGGCRRKLSFVELEEQEKCHEGELAGNEMTRRLIWQRSRFSLQPQNNTILLATTASCM